MSQLYDTSKPLTGYIESMADAAKLAESIIKKYGWEAYATMTSKEPYPHVRYRRPGEKTYAYCYGTRDFNFQNEGSL